MGTGEAASSTGLVIQTPVYNPSAGSQNDEGHTPSGVENDDFVAHLASPKVKPSRSTKSPSQLALGPTEEIEEENLGEAADGHVQKKQKKGGLSKKFMSMGNLLSEVEGEEEAEDKMEHEHEHGSGIQPLQASHRPESPRALEHTVGTVKPGLKKSMSELTLAAVSSRLQHAS
eukprot:230120-Rhodomonas_salina.3